MDGDNWAVEIRGLSKSFGSIAAIENVNLQIRPGTIHGLIGENGAGKSTTMKILFGMIKPDRGEILVAGRPCNWRSPRDAMAAGLGMVHQHFMLAGPVTAVDNVLLNPYPNPFARLPRAQARQRLHELSQLYHLEIDVDQKVENFSVGMQQRLEILKLLYRNATLIILDEPTAVLTPQEIETFFAQLRRLRDEGKTIVFSTHKLKEVMAITDDVTILRAGRMVGRRPTRQSSPQELAELMIGRQLKALPVRKNPESREPVLEVRDLALPPRLNKISFGVNCGEVVGIAGIDGNGQSELLRVLLQAHECGPELQGRVRVLNQDLVRDGRPRLTTAQLRGLGVGVLPEDRQRQGLLMASPVYENFLMGVEHTRPYQTNGLLNLSWLRTRTAKAMDEFDIRPRQVDRLARELSGGNQQKLVIARELQAQPKLIIAAHPTRGVDIGAIEFIHQQLILARDSGSGILLISSELDEIMALADRILVFFRGAISAEFAQDFDERKLGLAMGGSL